MLRHFPMECPTLAYTQFSQQDDLIVKEVYLMSFCQCFEVTPLQNKTHGGILHTITFLLQVKFTHQNLSCHSSFYGRWHHLTSIVGESKQWHELVFHQRFLALWLLIYLGFTFFILFYFIFPQKCLLSLLRHSPSASHSSTAYWGTPRAARRRQRVSWPEPCKWSTCTPSSVPKQSARTLSLTR